MIGHKARLRISIALLFGIVALAPLAAQNALKPEELRARVLTLAGSFKGVPYRYGAESPYAFDCSGFVRYVYREAAGLELPRSARSYTVVGRAVRQSDALPGDIFIFNTVGTAASHVALYIGGGRLIHAVSDGPKTGVIESPLSDRYWGSRVIGVRSVLAALPVTPVTPPATAPLPSAPAASTRPAPADTSAPASAERSIADIGFNIPPSRQLINDPIPAQAGTSLAFTITNATGKAGDFIIQFYVLEPKTLSIREIHKEKVHLNAGASHSLPPYAFDEPGKYKLAVKGAWGSLLLERGFEVVAAK